MHKVAKHTIAILSTLRTIVARELLIVSYRHTVETPTTLKIIVRRTVSFPANVLPWVLQREREQQKSFCNEYWDSDFDICRTAKLCSSVSTRLGWDEVNDAMICLRIGSDPRLSVSIALSVQNPILVARQLGFSTRQRALQAHAVQAGSSFKEKFVHRFLHQLKFTSRTFSPAKSAICVLHLWV